MPLKDPVKSKAYQRAYRLAHIQERKQYAQAYYKTPGYKARRARYWMKAKYSLSPEQYKDMLVKQNFACAICGKEQAKLKRRLVIDHNHTTGKVRGLLCNPCNNKRVDTVENFGHLIPVIQEYLKRGL